MVNNNVFTKNGISRETLQNIDGTLKLKTAYFKSLKNINRKGEIMLVR